MRCALCFLSVRVVLDGSCRSILRGLTEGVLTDALQGQQRQGNAPDDRDPQVYHHPDLSRLEGVPQREDEVKTQAGVQGQREEAEILEEEVVGVNQQISRLFHGFITCIEVYRLREDCVRV
jgi:hypothetical protein